MTERLAEATRRIENVQQLGVVVTAMRGISASRIQQAHGLLRGVRAHAAVIGRAIGRALPLVPDQQTPTVAHPTRSGMVLFTAEQGFAGAFSDRMLEAARRDQNCEKRDIFLVGTRGYSLAREHGLQPFWNAAMVPHANLVPGLANRIADGLYAWLAGPLGHRVDVIVPTWSATMGVVADRRSLLPFDFRRFAITPSGQAPLTTLPPPVLLARLAEEYIFAELCDAALTAFAAENEARVATMLSAKGSLDTMLSGLQALERHIRQEEITAEIVELASNTARSVR
ncbi:MAG TPA: FoF1 ATP synthase subunit gamma [Rhodopila sp.]|nr:FoF1 ATP synthase subunit gamma [Rhodopila sp.]